MQQDLNGNNIIITDPSSNLRALGRNALAGKWQSAIVAVIVYTLCIQVPPAILNTLFGVNMGDLYSINMGYSYNVGTDAYSTVYNSMPMYSPLSGLYTLLVSGAMELGLTLFFLAMFRRQIVGIGDVFLGFERFGKALGLFLFQGLFIFLWSLLFIVPGIIAAIRYSQAFFILADDPNKGIRQCMDESKWMMRGNKAKYFCLSLSFIGWAILAAIPAGVLSSLADTLYLSNFITIIFDVVGALCMAPVIAYIYSSQAGFYEILAGHLIKETEPAPINPEAIPAAMRQAQAPAEPAPQRPVQPQAPVNPVPQEVPQTPVQPQNQVPPQGQVPPQAAPQRPVQPQAPVNPVPQEVPQTPVQPQQNQVPPQSQVPPQAAPQRPVQPQAPVNPVPQEVPQTPVQPQQNQVPPQGQVPPQAAPQRPVQPQAPVNPVPQEVSQKPDQEQ